MTSLSKIGDWWAKLPEDVRQSLVAEPAQKIDGETNLAITEARGYGVPIAGWVDVPGSETAHLSAEEQAWIREHSNDS